MKGNTVYCGRRKSTIHVKIGAVANQADRPEKSQSLQIALLGTYGRIASWAADVDHNVLPDCNTCHKKRLEGISSAGLGSATMDRKCGRCCQWDLTSDSPALKRIKPPELYPKEFFPELVVPHTKILTNPKFEYPFHLGYKTGP